MTYSYQSVAGHGYSKWDTIQEDVADAYSYLEEDEDVEDDIELDDVEDVEFDLDEWEEM